MLWTAGSDGVPDWFSQRWYEYTGLLPEESYKEWRDVFHQEDLPETNKRWSHSMATGEQYDVEYPVQAARRRLAMDARARAPPARRADGRHPEVVRELPRHRRPRPGPPVRGPHPGAAAHRHPQRQDRAVVHRQGPPHQPGRRAGGPGHGYPGIQRVRRGAGPLRRRRERRALPRAPRGGPGRPGGPAGLRAVPCPTPSATTARASAPCAARPCRTGRSTPPSWTASSPPRSTSPNSRTAPRSSSSRRRRISDCRRPRLRPRKPAA